MKDRARTESRLRQSLRQDLKRIAQRGRGLALHYGYRLKSCGYGARPWPKLPIPDWRTQRLMPRHTAVNALHQLLACTAYTRCRTALRANSLRSSPSALATCCQASFSRPGILTVSVSLKLRM